MRVVFFGEGVVVWRGICGDLKLEGVFWEEGVSEALRLLQETGLSGQRHEGRGVTSEAHPGAKAEVRGGQ